MVYINKQENIFAEVKLFSLVEEIKIGAVNRSNSILCNT
jgi:hypothetical protein